MLTAEIQRILQPDRKSNLLIITAGNEFRGDDAVGPYIASQLGAGSKNIAVLNAGDKPENIFDRAVQARPQKVVIIDAADFRGHPGEVQVIQEENISSVILSTHNFPLTIISRMISEDTGAKVFFLGIQPKNVKFGEGLSGDVKLSADEIISFINRVEEVP